VFHDFLSMVDGVIVGMQDRIRFRRKVTGVKERDSGVLVGVMNEVGEDDRSHFLRIDGDVIVFVFFL